MAAKANREWQDLPKRLSCFTVRNATMIDLDTKEIIRHYSANTKIAVVQKCVTPEGTYYRTAESALHGLNHAFKGTAFGFPDEEAPSAPIRKFSALGPNTHTTLHEKGRSFSLSTETNKHSRKEGSSKDGEEKPSRGWLKKFFRRKGNEAKNS